MATGLTPRPLGGPNQFNWVFLIEVLVNGVLALFFLFYFNRLLGTVLSYGIRAWTWHRYRAYIDISALQISPLGGRIFFKSLRYHAHNITLLVHDGHITWRYWLRMVQEAEVFEVEDTSAKTSGRSSSTSPSENGSSNSRNEKPRSRSIGKEEKAGGRSKKQLPCRISVKVSGVEAFIYNRSPVFDNIVEQTLKRAQAKADGHETSDPSKRESDRYSSSGDRQSPEFEKSKPADNASTASIGRVPTTGQTKLPPIPAWLRIFPIHIECKRAAGVVGNENTTSIIVGKVEKSTGTIDAGRAGPFDLYKLLFNFDVETINVTMKPNRDFKQRQLDAAKRILLEKTGGPVTTNLTNPRHLQKTRTKWTQFSNLLRRHKSHDGSLRSPSPGAGDSGTKQPDPLPGQNQWHGLERYLEDKVVDEHDEWQDVEYAKASTLADIDFLTMRFYFDMPGKVPAASELPPDGDYSYDMNGSKPPDYGMDFFVYGGVVTYGPWADRQRINLQQIFFPASFVDATPVKRLQPGEYRNWSLFKIFISMEKDLVLRIPSREPSKDDKWQGRAESTKKTYTQDVEEPKRKGKHGRKSKNSRWRKAKRATTAADARPYGWVDITVKADTTVNYTMDMFSRADGYVNKLDVDAKGIEISSSVNHGLLCTIGAVSVMADLSQPKAWNVLRSWPFDIEINDLELFILRDHLFLIIDLVNDWSSGPLAEFFTFVPYRYNMHILLRNFCMYLNVNDSNIVSDPANFDKNDYLTLEGLLDTNLSIDMEKFRPVRNMITFDLLATDMRMRMLSPLRSSFSSLLKDKQVATLPKLTLSGSYSGHIEQRPGLTDTLRFDIVGSGLSLMAYGFLVRSLVNVKENYFGDYMHFKTLEEFQEADDDLMIANLKTASLPKPNSINELDVILCIIAEDASIMLPTNLYSGEEFVSIELPVANLDLRILSYYLDMGLQLSPISILTGKVATDESGSSAETESNTQLFVKHVDLDGHRAFGLPPNEPAYISQWNIDIGAVTGEFSSAFVHDLAMAARSFVFSFPDRENSLPLSSPTDVNDITFVQVHTDTVRIWMHLGNDALLFSTQPIEVSTNDLAGDLFSQRIAVLAPKVTLAIADGRSASRYRTKSSRREPVRTYAFFQTGVAVNVTLRAPHFATEKRKQQAHLRTCDARTHRAQFLLHPDPGFVPDVPGALDFEPPCMPYPILPPPLDRFGRELQRPESLRSVQTTSSSESGRIKSSSSSIAASVRSAAVPAPETGNGLEPLGHHKRNPSPAFRSRSRSSVSSIVRSGIQRTRSDTGRSEGGLAPTTMAFSSPYSEPYFPLDTVEPDETLVPPFLIAEAHDPDTSDASLLPERVEDAGSDIAEPQVSVFINLTPGIRFYIEPHVGETVAKVLQIVLPHNPSETLDAFQMDAIDTVLAEQTHNGKPGKLVEININLASAALRVVNPIGQSDSWDQVDVSLHSSKTLVRLRTGSTASEQKDAVAVHTTLQSMAASLREYDNHEALAPAFNADIQNVLIWVAATDIDSIHAAIAKTDVTISGDHADYLFDLAVRLVPLVEDMKNKIQSPLHSNRNRLLLLIKTLMHNSEGVGEPAFLASLSYILRSFPGHLRNEDSWKILMRFRHVWQCLSGKSRDDLLLKFKSISFDDHIQVSTKELEDWGQWRNWDIPNVGTTVVFRELFRHVEGKILTASPDRPLALTLRTEHVRLAIATTAGTNEVLVRDLAVGVEQIPPSQPTGLMLADENTRTRTIIQLNTNSIAIALDWSAFGIAEMIVPSIPKLQQILPATSNADSVKQSKTLEERLSRHEFHFVLSADSGCIDLRTIHLHHRSRAEGMKVCLIGTSQASDRYGQCISGLVNANIAITELFGLHAKRIWRTSLTSPSVYADYVQPLAGIEEAPSIVVALSYRELELLVQQQAPAVLQTVDTVIRDEVTRIMHLVETIKSGSEAAHDDPTQTTDQASSGIKIQVALLAGKLRIEIALLSTLSYKLEGTAASFRVAPGIGDSLGIDFDVGGQNHAFVNTSANGWIEQTILDVPPINGKVSVQQHENATRFSVAATLEQVRVDAAALHGLMSVTSRPEVQSVISTIKASVEEIKEHATELKSLKPESAVIRSIEADSPKKAVLFEVRFALLGIKVAVQTGSTKKESTASIVFGVGPMHMTASNKSAESDGAVLLPEVHARVRNIGAQIEVQSGKTAVPCGNVDVGIDVTFKTHIDHNGKLARELRVQSSGLEVNAYPETAATVLNIINHLHDRLKSLDLSKEAEYLRRVRDTGRKSVVPKISAALVDSSAENNMFSAEDLLSIRTSIELRNIQVAWLVHQSFAHTKHAPVADLILSIDCIEFSTSGIREARLTLDDLQLSLTKKSVGVTKRSFNSALLPNVTFSVGYWSVGKNRSLAFKAAGKPLELRLESKFVSPLNAAQKSITAAIEGFKANSANWKFKQEAGDAPRTQLFDVKRIGSVLVEADFDGAVVYMQGSIPRERTLSTVAASTQQYEARHGRYGQFANEGALMQTELRAPGIALKCEYNANDRQPTVNGELRIDASSNMLLPNVVPLLLEVSHSVSEVMKVEESKAPTKNQAEPTLSTSQKFFEDDSIITADPTAIFGKTKVDLGLRVCRQEFGLSCQPIARVDAKAGLEDFYITMNTVHSDEHGHFFAVSAVVTKLSAAVKHMYSREPTLSYDMESISLSVLNNKHLSGSSGISAVLKINPTRLHVNAKQLQDLLLFREIWLPPEIRSSVATVSAQPPQSPGNRPDDIFAQRYQAVASAAAFPWNATICIAELAVDLDLGQSIGKSSFSITNLWASQAKSSHSEQNLCIGMSEMAINSTGRMSGFVKLGDLSVRTAIQWPEGANHLHRTPLIQASVGFQRLRAKAAFDYQAFAFGDIEGFDFLMYNVREEHSTSDRLVAVLDCEKAYIFCTSTSPAQAVGLYQAFDRLIQEKQQAFTQSLRDIEKHLRRESTIVPTRFGPVIPSSPLASKNTRDTISLHTDVVLTVGAVSFGVFPTTFFDSQIFKLEANNIQARFAVGNEGGKIHSGLGMTLGQLQVALASVRRLTAVPKALDVTVDEVITSAINSKGGIILRVPKVVAAMQTWQTADSNHVDYIFKSLFAGKIDVGWNLSRINFIQGMWTMHSRALASRLGKSLPESAVKITAAPAEPPSKAQVSGGDSTTAPAQQEKITAEVNLPQSRYEYRALEPPIIETPQLRDMGEATPPLEWIGLHRDRLPNVTHQIIIVSLIEVAKEVEDAYERILGSS